MSLAHFPFISSPLITDPIIVLNVSLHKTKARYLLHYYIRPATLRPKAPEAARIVAILIQSQKNGRLCSDDGWLLVARTVFSLLMTFEVAGTVQMKGCLWGDSEMIIDGSTSFVRLQHIGSKNLISFVFHKYTKLSLHIS